MLVRLYSAAPVSLHGTQYTSDHNTHHRLSFVLNIDCNVVKMCFSERYAAVCIPSETPSKRKTNTHTHSRSDPLSEQPWFPGCIGDHIDMII
jgi:hypothetical protein